MGFKQVVPAVLVRPQADEDAKQPSRDRDEVVLGERARRGLWLLLMAVQIFNTSLLAMFAAVYFRRDTPGSLLWIATLYFLFADAYKFLSQYSMVVASCYALLGSIFAVCALRMLWLSLRHRELRFGEATTPSSKQPPVQAPVYPTRLSWLITHVDRARFAVGVHGPYFEIRLLVDEIIELASQTIAAYSTSESISNVYLNQIYGVVIFTNCISALVFHRVFKESQVKKRVACLVTDLVLDFVWGSLLPLWMFIPVSRLNDELSVATADTENSARSIERVLVLSWPSFLLTVIPFISSLLILLEIQSILHETAPVSASPPTSTHRPANFHERKGGDRRVASSTSTRSRCLTRVLTWIHTLIVVYGCAILVISLSASEVFVRVKRQPQLQCNLRLHPWFATKEACLLRRINCTVAEISGSASELDAVFDLFDEGSLSDLYLSSCGYLEIPRAVDRFANLMTLNVEDSWIVDWPTTTIVPALDGIKTIKLTRVGTNTTLPGLVAHPISTSVEYIRFDAVANAAAILDSVGTNWEDIRYLDLHFCNLTDVPAILATMPQLLTLSLIGNDLHVVRDDWISHTNLRLIGLWLDLNPRLTTLSDLVWRQAASCDMFSLQLTNLSAVPDWLPSVAQPQFVLYAYGTPLCDGNMGLLANSPASVQGLVSCIETEG